MDKKQFLKELEEKLMCLPYDEREKAVAYYEEYFDDAGEENETDVLNELGNVDSIVREIIENSTSSIDSISRNKSSNYNYDNNRSYEYNYDNNKSYEYNNNSQNYNNSTKDKYKTSYQNSENENNSTENKYNNYNSYYNNSNDTNNNKYNYSNNSFNKKNKSAGWIVAIVIICILSSPILICLIGCVIGIVGTIIGFVYSAFAIALSTIIGLFTIPFVGFVKVGQILYLIGKGIIGLFVLIIILIGIVKIIKLCKDKMIDKNDNY